MDLNKIAAGLRMIAEAIEVDAVEATPAPKKAEPAPQSQPAPQPTTKAPSIYGSEPAAPAQPPTPVRITKEDIISLGKKLTEKHGEPVVTGALTDALTRAGVKMISQAEGSPELMTRIYQDLEALNA